MCPHGAAVGLTIETHTSGKILRVTPGGLASQLGVRAGTYIASVQGERMHGTVAVKKLMALLADHTRPLKIGFAPLCENQKTEDYKDGSRYIGQMKNGKRHGLGVYIWPSGDRYEGQFKNHIRHGQGIYLYDNGNRYDGQWENDLKHGKGVLIYPDGTRFESQWKEGIIN